MDILLCYSTRLVLAMVACERGEGVGRVDIGSEISFSCACFLLVCTYYERVLGSQSNSRHRLLYVNTILMACTLRVLINVCAHLEVFTQGPRTKPCCAAAPCRARIIGTAQRDPRVLRDPFISLCPHDQGNKVSPHRISERKTMLHLFLHYYMTSAHDDKATCR